MLQGFVHNIDGIVIRPSYYILYCYYLPGFYSSKTVVTFETISSSDGSKVVGTTTHVLSFGDGKKVGPKDDWNDSWRSW